jgi:hypothetical protein
LQRKPGYSLKQGGAAFFVVSGNLKTNKIHGAENGIHRLVDLRCHVRSCLCHF